MAAQTMDGEITFQGLMGPFDVSTLRIQLRNDGALYWARALWNENNAGGGHTKIGNLALEVKNSNGVYEAQRVVAVYADSGASIWTDETYNPPNGTRVRARFLATWGVESPYPDKQWSQSHPT